MVSEAESGGQMGGRTRSRGKAWQLQVVFSLSRRVVGGQGRKLRRNTRRPSLVRE